MAQQGEVQGPAAATAVRQQASQTGTIVESDSATGWHVVVSKQHTLCQQRMRFYR